MPAPAGHCPHLPTCTVPRGVGAHQCPQPSRCWNCSCKPAGPVLPGMGEGLALPPHFPLGLVSKSLGSLGDPPSWGCHGNYPSLGAGGGGSRSWELEHEGNGLVWQCHRAEGTEPSPLPPQGSSWGN